MKKVPREVREFNLAKPDYENLAMENEVTLGVHPDWVSAVLRAFAKPVPNLTLQNGKVELRRSQVECAFYIYLENNEPGTSDRVIFYFTRDGSLRAKYSPKRWAFDNNRHHKLELKVPPLLDAEECSHYLRSDGRRVVSGLVKKKWKLRYGPRSTAKIRFDWIVPVSPTQPKVHSQPFFDLEFECQSPNNPEELAKTFLVASGLSYQFRPIISRKADRAKQFTAAYPPTSANSLKDYIRRGLEHADKMG